MQTHSFPCMALLHLFKDTGGFETQEQFLQELWHEAVIN